MHIVKTWKINGTKPGKGIRKMFRKVVSLIVTGAFLFTNTVYGLPAGQAGMPIKNSSALRAMSLMGAPGSAERLRDALPRPQLPDITTNVSVEDLEKISLILQRDIIEMIHKAKSGHPGGSLSMIDIVTALYFGGFMRYDAAHPKWESRDRFILSKGHAAPGLYAALANLGFFDKSELSTLRQLGSILQGHADMTTTPGIDMSTGSLGVGLSVAKGMAIAAKMQGRDYNTYCMMGDGETQEGQVSEAARHAAAMGLDNLIAFVDLNGMQIDGKTSQVDVRNQEKWWRAHGWRVIKVNGNDMKSVVQGLEEAKNPKGKNKGKPTVILAETIKGKGLPAMDKHGAAPKDDEKDEAVRIINAKLAELGGDTFDINTFVKSTKLGNDRKEEIDEINQSQAMSRSVKLSEIARAATPVGEYEVGKKVSTRSAGGDELLNLGIEDTRVVVLCADLKDSVMMGKFDKAFGSFSAKNSTGRYIPIGIAEADMFSTAAGLAACGMIPVVGTFSIFTARMIDQVNAILKAHLPVIIVGTHVGLAVGPDGATHQDGTTMGMFLQLPDVKVYGAADAEEARAMYRHAYDVASKKGGVHYIQLARPDTAMLAKPENWQKDAAEGFYTIYDTNPEASIHDVAIVSTGVVTQDAIEAAKELQAQGKKVKVINITQPRVLMESPADVGEFLYLLENAKSVVTVADALPNTLGNIITNALFEARMLKPVKKLGIQKFGESGKPEQLYAKHGFDKAGIVKASLEACKEADRLAGEKTFPDEDNAVNIAISIGGHKLAVGLVNSKGEILGEPAELKWREELGISPDTAGFWDEKNSERFLDLAMDLIQGVLSGRGVNIANVKKVGVGFAGPVNTETGIAGTPFAAPNTPFDKYPIMKRLQQKIEDRFKIKGMTTELLNDCGAAVKGELSPKGALHEYQTGCAFIIGGGINITAAVNGSIYYGEGNEIRELGHNLVLTDALPPAYQHSAGLYTYTGLQTKGDHPKDATGQNLKGDFEDRCAGPNLARQFAKELFLHKKEPSESAHGISRAIEAYRKSKLARQFDNTDKILQILTKEGALTEDEEKLRSMAVDAVLISVTTTAREGNRIARQWIEAIAIEIGHATAAFIAAYQNEDFIKHIILVSGVNENFGKGVLVGTAREDLYISTIRLTVREALVKHYGLGQKKASELAQGIERSQLTYEREFLAFAPETEGEKAFPIFGSDVEFLRKQFGQNNVIVLSDGNAEVAVVAGLQARVMTSTFNGASGQSLGWVNRAHIEKMAKGESTPHMNPAGGEDRFWVGPEGGQFSYFFKPGSNFVFDDWQTPGVIDIESFNPASIKPRSATFSKKTRLQNYSGTEFDILIDRTIRLLSRQKAQEELRVTLPAGVSLVAYESDNKITNIGNEPWTKATGIPSVWILGMYPSSSSNTVVIPYNPGSDAEMGQVVNDDYFGKVPPNRLQVGDKAIFFKGDGQARGKIGLSPKRARPILGSYDAANKVLTIVQYTKPEGATDYVNSAWKIQDDPFNGDAANSYNDDGNLGEFFELESSSPVKALAPQESISHVHRTIHMHGEEAELDRIAQATLGVSLEDIKNAFDGEKAFPKEDKAGTVAENDIPPQAILARYDISKDSIQKVETNFLGYKALLLKNNACLVLGPDNEYVLSTETRFRFSYRHDVADVKLSPDAKYVAFRTTDHNWEVWSLGTRKNVLKLDLRKENTRNREFYFDLEFSEYYEQVLVYHKDWGARVYDLNKKGNIPELTIDHAFEDVIFTPDGRNVLVLDYNCASVYKIATKEQIIRVIHTPRKPLRSYEFIGFTGISFELPEGKKSFSLFDGEEISAAVKAFPDETADLSPAKSLMELREKGQSVWFDGALTDEQFSHYRAKGVVGQTTNLTIIDNAIAAGMFDAQIAELIKQGKAKEQIYDAVVMSYIHSKAQQWQPVYEETKHLNGYVSIEVNPLYAYDAEKTIAEAQRLVQEIGMPNVMVKVPATKEGITAIEELTYLGINVNVTLLFGVDNYTEVAQAYIKGLKRRAAEGKGLSDIQSVASFFVSRVNCKPNCADEQIKKQIAQVDSRIAELRRTREEQLGKPLHERTVNIDGIAEIIAELIREASDLKDLLAKAAIANTVIAYGEFEKLFYADEFKQLKEMGANYQRLLWASTGAKDNELYADGTTYDPLIYIINLPLGHTVNTIPGGKPSAGLDKLIAADSTTPEPRNYMNLEQAREVFAELAKHGIDVGKITQDLQKDGVDSFAGDYEKSLKQITTKIEQLSGEKAFPDEGTAGDNGLLAAIGTMQAVTQDMQSMEAGQAVDGLEAIARSFDEVIAKTSGTAALARENYDASILRASVLNIALARRMQHEEETALAQARVQGEPATDKRIKKFALLVEDEMPFSRQLNAAPEAVKVAQEKYGSMVIRYNPNTDDIAQILKSKGFEPAQAIAICTDLSAEKLKAAKVKAIKLEGDQEGQFFDVVSWAAFAKLVLYVSVLSNDGNSAAELGHMQNLITRMAANLLFSQQPGNFDVNVLLEGSSITIVLPHPTVRYTPEELRQLHLLVAQTAFNA